ncbi:MAG TPA: hypothetical protein VGK02_00165 [Candidatus Aquicultor sp.]|jgi:hypothetical protein
MQETSKQQVTSTQDQLYVNCKNCGHAQYIDPEEIKGLHVACAGSDCSNTYSVKEGIKHAIVSDNDFLAWSFISDTMITGTETISIGTVKEIKLKTPIKASKKIFIIQQNACDESVIYYRPVVILPEHFLIVSSGNPDMLGAECEVRWVLYANVKSDYKEPWREYLQRSKESLVSEDYQGAIVEAEIAVEVTIASVLWEILVRKKSIDPDVVEWILSKVQAASERLKRVMELAIGKAVSDISPAIYRNWARDVADKRNRIVHQGEATTKEEASQAIGAAFEIIWLLLELINQEPA